MQESVQREALTAIGSGQGGGPMGSDPLGSVLSDRDKRASAAQLLGHAYITAYVLIDNNRAAVELFGGDE